MSALLYVALGMVLGWCLHGRLTRNAAEQLRIVKARERDRLEHERAVRETARVELAIKRWRAARRPRWRMNVTEMN